MDWPHSPPHRFEGAGTFFVTGATYLKQHFYRSRGSLDRLRDQLFALAAKHEVELEAWALFSNHYHLVARHLTKGSELHGMLSELHSIEAIACNKADGIEGRKVWYQFRDTALTYERSWMARLRYTHENAVHHRLVTDATSYPWCSASWFARTGRPSFVKSVARFRVDQLNQKDEFEVDPIAGE